jgi:hypothetical protein
VGHVAELTTGGEERSLAGETLRHQGIGLLVEMRLNFVGQVALDAAAGQ